MLAALLEMFLKPKKNLQGEIAEQNAAHLLVAIVDDAIKLQSTK
jgi:hypothetical protein